MASDLIQIQLMSDLHLETPNSRPCYADFVIHPQCKYLTLLGDIGNVKDEALFQFLRTQVTQFETIFFVLGNHEAYDTTYSAAEQMMLQFETDINSRSNSSDGKFIFLNHRRHDLSATVTILGCTLYSRISQEQEQTVSMLCSDFDRISNWSINSHNEAHDRDLAWLNQQVALIDKSEPTRSIVVMTHHCPVMAGETASASHCEDANGIRTAFSPDLSAEVCWTNTRVVIWAFGHTHLNCDYPEKATGKRVIANQKGYRRSENVDFDSDKVIGISPAQSIRQIAPSTVPTRSGFRKVLGKLRLSSLPR